MFKKYIFFFFLNSLIFSLVAQEQYSMVSEIVDAKDIDSIKDEAFKPLIEEVMNFIEGTESGFNVQNGYEIIYYKHLPSGRKTQSARITRFNDAGKVEVLIKKTQGTLAPTNIFLDASNFHQSLSDLSQEVPSKFYKQYLFTPNLENEKSSRSVWIMKKDGVVTSLICAFNTPFIAVDKEDSNFPPEVVNELIAMDLTKPQPDKKKKKKKKKRSDK